MKALGLDDTGLSPDRTSLGTLRILLSLVSLLTNNGGRALANKVEGLSYLALLENVFFRLKELHLKGAY